MQRMCQAHRARITAQTRPKTPHKQLKETVGFKAGKSKNAGMFGREEKQQKDRRKPEEKRDRLKQREGETMVIIVSFRQLNPLLNITIRRK